MLKLNRIKRRNRKTIMVNKHNKLCARFDFVNIKKKKREKTTTQQNSQIKLHLMIVGKLFKIVFLSSCIPLQTENIRFV